MKSNHIAYEDTVFYKNIALLDKTKWVAYFRLLYDEREISHERLTESSQTQLMKSVGLSFSSERVQECITGCNDAWIELLNGFFRHYYSFIYTELVVAMHNYSDLVASQFRMADNHLDQGRKTDNLRKMAEVRQIINSLQKEMYNSRHGQLGNIVTSNTLFKGTVVEENAKQRSKKKVSHRDAASEEYE